MSDYNKDPFFDNNEENTKQPENRINNVNLDPFFDYEEQKSEVNNENSQQKEQPKKPTFEQSFPSYTVGQERIDVKPEAAKTRVGNALSLGIIIAIMIPILVISNVITSVFVFNSVWADAKTKFQNDINQVLTQTANVSGDVNAFIAYNVAKDHIDSVVEISSTYPSGSSSGSGFIATADGYVITNAHVITYEQSLNSGFGRPTQTVLRVCPTITCNFKNSTETYNLTVLEYNEDLDIAVCKIANPPANLTPVKFADSTLLQFGEPCVAIGNAQGYGLAVTEGVISAPIQYCALSGKTGKTAAVQHSAAINPGNSGGPLFNMYGYVIGINTFKLSTSADISIDGMGFAIPSAVAKDYINGLGLEGLVIEYSTPDIITE